MNQDTLIKLRNEYTKQFNDFGMKNWKKKKTYAYAQIVSSLDMAIKYMFEFDKYEI